MHSMISNKSFVVPLPLLFILFTTCQQPQTGVTQTNQVSTNTIPNSNGIFTLTIESSNLSEDMSAVSSNNDEIHLLLYDYSDSSHLGKLIFKKAIVFDSAHKKYVFTDNGIKEYPKDILLLLMEEDSFRSVTEMDSIVRNNYNQILPLYNNHELVKLGNYIGDDDILGYKIIRNFNSNSSVTIPITGILRADKYNYLIELKTQ